MKKAVLSMGVLVLLGTISCEKKEEKKAEEAPKPKQEQTVQQTQPKKEELKEVAAVSDARALADKKGCFACHDINRKKVGPAYVDVAKKYAGKEKAVEELVKSITKGSMGKWGSIPMTPQPVTQEEAKKLAEWILSLK